MSLKLRGEDIVKIFSSDIKKKMSMIVWTNLVIILGILCYIMYFTISLNEKSFMDERQKFESLTPAIRQDIVNYLDNSSDSAKCWAKFIGSNKLTMDSALDALSELNANPNVMAQIVYADSMEGYSTSYELNEHLVRVIVDRAIFVDYSELYSLTHELSNFAKTSDYGDVLITGAFTNYVNAENSIAFVSITEITDELGNPRKAFVMRVEPLEAMNERWVLLRAYPDCSISVINKLGDYIFRSSMMKKSNFYDFLISYNDISDLNIRQLMDKINTADDSGSFVMKNSLGNDTIFSYSTKGYNDWIVISAIEEKALHTADIHWSLVIVIMTVFTGLVAVNLFYFAYFTRRLNTSLVELEKANQAKTRFLSSMSHDIRTPMNAIIGLTTIASHNIDDKSSVRDSLHKISLAGKHLLTLINDILDISQVESGKFALKPVVFSISELSDDLVNILYQQTDDKKLKCDVYLHDISQELLFADKVRLNQICVNILSNAIKYTPEGGSIRIDLREESLPENPSKIRIIFKASDTGIGMAPEFIKNIFEPFERERDSRIDKVQGSGLGMAITKQIVDMLGGTISVESKEGEGSAFTVTLDIDRADDKQKKERNLGGLYVLVVGEETATDEICAALTRLGANSDSAETNAQILRLIENMGRRVRYDAVIIDRKMNTTDCLETARLIRSCHGGKNTQIFISAFSHADIENIAEEYGLRGFMPKPLYETPLFENLIASRIETGEIKTDEETSSAEDLDGVNLLVAEDNDLNWEVVRELLGMYNITADRAVNGQECVEMLKKAEKGTYLMIFMDIQMPIMNGYDAAIAIRSLEDKEKSQIPIIAMTADAFASDIAACRHAGMNEHIAKPIDLDSLIAEIRKYANKDNETRA